MNANRPPSADDVTYERREGGDRRVEIRDALVHAADLEVFAAETDGEWAALVAFTARHPLASGDRAGVELTDAELVDLIAALEETRAELRFRRASPRR